MFNSTNNTDSTYVKPTLYTGFTNATVLGINPRKEQIEEWLGRPYNLNVDYSKIDQRGTLVRPLQIWLRVDTEKGDHFIDKVAFFLSNEISVTSTGKTQYVNEVGNFVYGESETDLKENPKMAWFTNKDFRPAYGGERELYTFIQSLIKYDSRGTDAAFMKDAAELNIAPSYENGSFSWSLYDNDLTGLEKIIDWANQQSKQIGVLSCVRKSTKDDRTYYNQTFVSNADTFCRYVSAKTLATMEERNKSRMLTNQLFTIPFMEFDEEKCYQPAIPAQVATPAVKSFFNK